MIDSDLKAARLHLDHSFDREKLRMKVKEEEEVEDLRHLAQHILNHILVSSMVYYRSITYSWGHNNVC